MLWILKKKIGTKLVKYTLEELFKNVCLSGYHLENLIFQYIHGHNNKMILWDNWYNKVILNGFKYHNNYTYVQTNLLKHTDRLNNVDNTGHVTYKKIFNAIIGH